MPRSLRRQGVLLGMLLSSALLVCPSKGQTVNFNKHYSAPADVLIRQMVSGPDGALWFTATYFESNGVIGRMTTGGTITQNSIPAIGCTPNVAGCPNLSGITVGFDGALWFAENQANKIGRITTSGSWSDYLVPSANFNGTWIDGPGPITLGPDGACWFVERTANKIGRIDTSGRFLEYPAGNAGSSGGITTGPDGALWFTETFANKIGSIDTSGNVTEYFIPSASQFSAYPSGIVSGPDGALWFTEELGNNIGRITTSGAITEYPIPSGNAGAGSIVVGPDGALWFTEGSVNKIGRVTTAGAITEYPVPVSGYSPGSITKGPDGALWFIESPPNLVSSTDQIWQLVIGSPATISSINPNTATAGAASFTLTVNGNGFVSGSVVQWSGSALPTAYVNVTQLTAAVSANLIASAGSANITVLNPGGTVSNAVSFTINSATSTVSITSLNPNTTTAGGPAFTLTVNGSGFVSGSSVRWNGSPIATTFGGATQLTASVSAGLIATAGSASVTVTNPGGTISNALAFTINPTSATPTITSLSPSSATAGNSSFTLGVNGSGFVSGSAIRWNGSALTTTYVSATQLSAQVASNLIASAGSASVTVANPGGAISNAVTFSINSSGGGLSIITASPLPAGKVGTPYSQALAASGGTTPYKGWAVISGSLPTGMSLSALGSFLTGLLNGVPTTPGTFTFTVQVTDSNNTTATKQFSVTITGGSISISANGIVNAASYAGGSVAPGELITIFGAGLGPTTLVGLQLDSRGYVSTTLGGTQVLFDGVPAPMIYTQAGQVSVVVPYGVAGKNSTQVQVTYQGQSSNVVSVPISAVVPGIFTIDASGHGPGAIVNQDGTVNSANNPAATGSIVFAYATGEGQTNPPGSDGKPDGSPAPTPVAQPITATIGGVNAQVLYAGGVPGLVAGVLQVNVQIPGNVAVGNSVPIVLTVGGKTTQANVTLAVGTSGSQGLSITSLSSQTPTALTPLYISTKGINPSAPASVQFSNNTGFSVTSQPIRIASDGTVVVAVPLYLDPVNRTTSSGQVSVTVTQGNQTTAPSTINIQDLPAVSSYGTQLGQISHAFLVYETILTARRINELQAYQALPGNKVDTTQALGTLQTLLKGIIQVRSDVDRVSMNNALVISGGTLPNGLPLQFDRNSLDLMDRMIGLHLTEWAPAISSIASASSVVSPQTLERIISPLQLLGSGPVRSAVPTLTPRFVQRRVSREAEGLAAAPQATSGLTGIITAITNAANQISLAKATSDYYANDATAFDKGLAVAGGLGSLYGLVTVSASDAAKAAGDIYGGLVSSAGLLHNLGMELGDLAFLMTASSHGGDPAVVAEAWNDLQSNAHSATINTINTELSLISYGTDTEVFGSGVVRFLKSAGSQVALQSAALLTAAYDCAMASGGGCLSSVDNAALEAGSETTTLFNTDNQGFGIVTGDVQIANSTGIAAAQNEIQLSSNGITLDTMADQNGNYDLFVPLQAVPFDYARANFEIVDPFSPATLGPDVIDLSNLTTAAPFQLPLITGVCIDDDAGDPDFDDPDCDAFGLSSSQAFSLMRRSHRSIMPFDFFQKTRAHSIQSAK